MSDATSTFNKECEYDMSSRMKKCECEACKTVVPKKREFVEVDQELAALWIDEIKGLDTSAGVKAFKSNILPFSRVKKIMKANQEVKMVSAETAFALTKACELFLVELTRLSWIGTVQHKRKTLLNVDTHQAILQTECFDFLVDVIDGTIALEQESARRKRRLPSGQPDNLRGVPLELQQFPYGNGLLHQSIPPELFSRTPTQDQEQLAPGSYGTM